MLTVTMKSLRQANLRERETKTEMHEKTRDRERKAGGGRDGEEPTETGKLSLVLASCHLTADGNAGEQGGKTAHCSEQEAREPGIPRPFLKHTP